MLPFLEMAKDAIAEVSIQTAMELEKLSPLEQINFIDSIEDLDAVIDVPFTSDSGNITGIRYKLASHDLVVSFKNGPYTYHDVPFTAAMGFVGASSATRYLNDQIKGRYDYDSGEDLDPWL